MLLATHEGLFDLSETPVVKIGPANDLMGFTAAADQGVFYASGHPGNDSALPNPLGLIKSTDGGRTWEQLSRQNESDFHALTVAKSGIVAFDEVLRTSADGKTWKTVDADFNPAVLAAYPTSDIVLATVRNGVRRSTDGGTTWTVSTSAPVLRFAAFANAEEVIGIEPDGAVHYSPDAGTTWSAKGRVNDEVIAVAATSGKDGKPWIWAATPAGIVVSTDTGAIFRPVEDAS